MLTQMKQCARACQGLVNGFRARPLVASRAAQHTLLDLYHELENETWRLNVGVEDESKRRGRAREQKENEEDGGGKDVEGGW